MRCVVLLSLCLLSCARQTPDSLYRTSDALLKQGRLVEALASVETGLRSEPSWRFRQLKIEVLLSMSEGKKAIEALRAAEPEVPSNPEDRARFAMQQGYANFLLSDYSASAQSLDQARDLARPLSLPLLDSQIALRRGALEVRLDHPALAEEMFRGVLTTAVAHDDLYLQAGAIGNLGFLFMNTFRFEQAIYWLERARQAFERLGATNSVPRALGNLGWCYFRLGDNDRALEYLANAARLSQQIGNRYELQAWLGNTGNVLMDRDDFAGATKEFASALTIAREVGDQYWTGTWLSDLAMASIASHDFDAAERYNDEALRVKQKLGKGFDFQARVNRAKIAAGRREGGAEKLFKALLDEGSADPTSSLDAESGLAELLVAKGDRDRADGQFRSALALIERQQANLARDEYKLSYFASLIRLYQDYVDFLVASGQHAKALEVAESSRARVLDEKLKSDRKTGNQVSIAALQQFARASNSLLLSYWLAPERSFLWVVTPTAVTLHTLPGEKRLTGLIEAYGTLLENLRDPLDSESPAGRELAETLLGPVRPLLNSGVRIVIVPDRALHSLNFETLPDPAHASHYLIDSATVSVAPSLSVLSSAKVPANSKGSILVIGDPDPAVEEYPRLPFAAKEIALIEQNFANGRSVVVQGGRATPAAYRDNDPAKFSFIHFAAHASANRENPLDSALILSRHESGYSLSARDVMNVPLRADLVTLSACRSAGARMYSGEGLVGLSWAFLRAGARNVVAGLWDVNDMSTANLMSDFYSRLTRGAAPADALREAKLKLLHSAAATRKPFYWGPFQMYTGSGM